MRLRVTIVSCAILAVLAACNEVPVRDLTDSYSVQVQVLRDKGKPAKLDVLWVVDDSTSMCQEQQSLADSFNVFLNVFQSYSAIDMRLAVTTTNVCTPSDPNRVRGDFVYRPNISVETECVESRRFPCVEGGVGGVDSCSQMKGVPDPEKWRCKIPSSGSTTNPIPTYLCDAPPDVGVIDPFEGHVLESYSSSCVYTCDRGGDGTECPTFFGMPDSCKEGGAICNSGCDLGNCMEDASLDDGNDCTLRCRGRECNDVCMELTGNDADCANRCDDAGATCETVCGTIERAAKCDVACGSMSGAANCGDRCTRYLGDWKAAACDGMCATGLTEDDCIDKCLDSGAGMAEAGFLCLMVCSNDYNCQENCINEFGASNYQCLCPGGNCDNRGCARVPRWMYCPGTMTQDFSGSVVWSGGPSVLDNEEADRWAVKWIKGDWTLKARAEVDSGVWETLADGPMEPPGWDPAWKALPTDDSDASFEARKVLRDKVFEHLFSCMTSVVMSQGVCGGQEQGLLAAWMALDKDGENAQQARDFLRDDAYLLIIVISDEDDCSSPEYNDGGEWRNYVTSQDRACPCLRDENGCLPSGECDYSQCQDKNGTFQRSKCPLYSTASLTNRLRSLKPDPAQVLFAAVVGNALVSGEGGAPTAEAVQDRFFECRCYYEDRLELELKHNYICSSEFGVAEYGKRYIDVAESFGVGRYGQIANICETGAVDDGETTSPDEKGVGVALKKIAELVVPLLGQICLPRPLEWDCEGRCTNIFDDNVAGCAEVCAADDCMESCATVFDGKPGCAEICRASKYIEVRQFNGDGTCARPLDGNGNCPALVETVGSEIGDFSLVRNSPMCPTFKPEDGERPENAIQFTRALGYTDKVEIVYRASTDFCNTRCSGYFNQDIDDEKFCMDVCGHDTEHCVRNCLIDGNYCSYICNVVVDDCRKMCNTLLAECENGQDCDAAGIDAAACNARCELP